MTPCRQCSFFVIFISLRRESYEAYESCLHWLADKDSLRSHILVAMGSLAYKVGNESGSGWFGLV
jgi:hypothetical protein